MRSKHSFSARKSVKFNGLGIVDVEDRNVTSDREYRVWVDMLGRCCSDHVMKRPKLKSYIGCELDESFKFYSLFYEWLHPRFNIGSQLDKDIKVRGNKIYGPETCLVVSKEMNQAFQMKPKNNELPQGVKARPKGAFAATVFTENGLASKNFYDPFEAHRCWQRSKASRILRLSELESEEARPYIVKRAKLLFDDADNQVITGEFL